MKVKAFDDADRVTLISALAGGYVQKHGIPTAAHTRRVAAKEIVEFAGEIEAIAGGEPVVKESDKK